MQEENELLEKIEQRKFKYQRKQSSIINNFFTIITIALVCIVMIWYVNYILPGQEQDKQNELKRLEKLEVLKEKQNIRLEQIKLSKRLNEQSQ